MEIPVRLPRASCVVFLVSLLLPLVVSAQNTQKTDAPPVAPIRPVTTDYFGTKVVDPYRYIENLKDPEVEGWFKEQGYLYSQSAPEKSRGVMRC